MAAKPKDMDRLDRFAEAALTGLLAAPGTRADLQKLVQEAYEVAEAMLEERMHHEPPPSKSGGTAHP
jgi:hypothetical protein